MVGVVAGYLLPDDLDIGFAVPATFIALLLPGVTDRPAVVTAAVAGVVAVASAGLPRGLNVIVAALAGIATARIVTGRSERP